MIEEGIKIIVCIPNQNRRNGAKKKKVDVIDVQFSLLQEKINNCQDFDDARKAHDEYLENISNQCFLAAKIINQALFEIFELCLQLSRLVQKATFEEVNRSAINNNNNDAANKQKRPSSLSSWDRVSQNEIQKLCSSFQNQSDFLFTVLSGVKDQAATPYLSQLLLRFDYNGFMSSKFIKQSVFGLQ